MVAVVEVIVVLVLLVLGAWWFLRTPLVRAHRRSSADPGQHGANNATDLPYGGSNWGPH